ncbi:SRPBCC family protein [Streptomyces sp. NPDC046465]|uniref:SRPBCC family protein n=1 Tax=Streptomyces sp. NPDC046465 TaxID=3155810 RepID=UPI0033E7480B
MEHEVFVPVSAERLRQVLADPERVAGAVPGLQRDAEDTAGPLAGRLKVRVGGQGGHTITYRGSARTEARGDGTYAIEAEGAEVRGSGSVKLTLIVRFAPAVGGTNLTFAGGAVADGRIAEGSPQAVESAMHRLLERFAEGLGAVAPPDTVTDVAVDAAGTHTVTVFEAEAEAEDEDGADDLGDLDDIVVDDASDVRDGVDMDDIDDVDGLDDVEDADDVETIDVPPAEAAHARRTMIGRSAEEVDHAPPRGRYAPAPAPESLTASATLRWAAPAAAVALASAIVVGRALRRRR